MQALRFAWLNVVRQPARACLGILGVAAVGALLFDMLLLSRGLVLSFGELLDRSGFDVRVLATDAPAFTGPRIAEATKVAASIAALPEIEAVLQLRVRDAEVVAVGLGSDPGQTGVRRGSDEGRTGVRGRSDRGQPPARSRAERSLHHPTEPAGESQVAVRPVDFIGADPRVRSLWRIVEGQDLGDGNGASRLVVNQNLARRLGLSTGSTLSIRGRCSGGAGSLPARFTVAGIADFPFDSAAARTVAGTLADADRLCGEETADASDLLLVRSTPASGAFGAAAAIRRLHPELHVVTNEEMVERFSRVEFSYFRQISTVLASVTLFFGFLLIAVLLTVSVNQRLGEIAALRAVGLSRRRVVAGVLWESIVLIGAGGMLALPLGIGLSVWLDAILRTMPGVPTGLYFFVFEPRALVIFLTLLGVAAVGAALYPMRIVAVLPIAATLRREIVS